MTTVEPRNIIDISKQVMDIIPKNEIQLINEIENYIRSLWNQPPEVLKGSLCWSEFSSIFVDFNSTPFLPSALNSSINFP